MQHMQGPVIVNWISVLRQTAFRQNKLCTSYNFEIKIMASLLVMPNKNKIYKNKYVVSHKLVEHKILQLTISQNVPIHLIKHGY